MKKYLLPLAIFCILLFTFKTSFSQGLSSSLPTDEAQQRIKLYNRLKKTVITDAGIKKAESIKIKSSVVLDFLGKIDGTHDGVRFYFVSTKDESTVSSKYRNQLAILLVATKEKTGSTGTDGKPLSVDDPSIMYILYHDKLQKVTSEDIDKLKVNYETGVMTDIQNFFTNDLSINLEESKSIWFSKTVLFEKPAGSDLDLKSYLKKNTEVKSIRIYFSSFTKDAVYDGKPLSFKMDVIFELIGDLPFQDNRFFTLALPEIAKNAERFSLEKVKLVETYGDTGLPCPPNKCP